MADPRPDVMEIERRRIKRMEMKDQIKYELTSSYSESASSFHPSSGDFIGGKPIRKWSAYHLSLDYSSINIRWIIIYDSSGIASHSFRYQIL